MRFVAALLLITACAVGSAETTATTAAAFKTAAEQARTLEVTGGPLAVDCRIYCEVVEIVRPGIHCIAIITKDSTSIDCVP